MNTLRLLAGALLLLGSMSSVPAEPLPADARSRIIDLMLEASSTIALKVHGNRTKDAQAALSRCREAEKITARYDRSPHHQGYIGECFGQAEYELGNHKAACAHFASAVQSFGAVPASDRDYRTATKKVASNRDFFLKIGCKP